MMKIVFIGDSITDANHNYSEDVLGEGYVKIIADGKTIYKSPEMGKTSSPVLIDVNI